MYRQLVMTIGPDDIVTIGDIRELIEEKAPGVSVDDVVIDVSEMGTTGVWVPIQAGGISSGSAETDMIHELFTAIDPSCSRWISIGFVKGPIDVEKVVLMFYNNIMHKLSIKQIDNPSDIDKARAVPVYEGDYDDLKIEPGRHIPVHFNKSPYIKTTEAKVFDYWYEKVFMDGVTYELLKDGDTPFPTMVKTFSDVSEYTLVMEQKRAAQHAEARRRLHSSRK